MQEKRLGFMPLFDPEGGITILEPPAPMEGAWNGGHSVIYDSVRKSFLMYYRTRNPRRYETSEHRGATAYIAESGDGIHFRPIWSVNKGQMSAVSIEKGCVVRAPWNTYLLYMSYEHADTNQWQIDVMEADQPDAFVPQLRKTFLRPSDADCVSIKDPIAVLAGRMFFVFANYGFEPGREAALVAFTRDGFVVDGTERVFTVSKSGWDRHGSRLTSIVHVPPVYYAFYDGCAKQSEVCEESSGLFMSFDPVEGYRRLTPDNPIHRGVRYVDAVVVNDRFYFYYEFTRPDGSHELRLNIV